jgi:uncharacterized protein YjlB
MHQEQMPQIQTFHFDNDGHIPNHPTLPLLLYPGVLAEEQNRISACRALFERHQWGGVWVNGVFSYHHYHSSAHEVLAVANGSAQIRFGGPHGTSLQVQAGDVVLIPAGVGHCKEESSTDFRVVGAYPAGQRPDICTGDPAERPGALERIRQVPLPQSDPLYGAEGPVQETWHNARDEQQTRRS